MKINRMGVIRGATQKGTGNTQSLQDIAKTANEKPNNNKIIASFAKSIEHYSEHQLHPDVRRILELVKSDRAQAVEYIGLLANGQPLPAAESIDSNRVRAQKLAATEEHNTDGAAPEDELVGFRYEPDTNGISDGNDIY